MRLLLTLVLLVPVFAQKPGDDAAVRDVVRRYVDARDRRDAKATEALFTADADQLVSSGEWRRGRDAVVRWEVRHATIGQGEPARLNPEYRGGRP